MRIRQVACALALAAFAAGGLSAARASAEDTYTIKRAFKAGEVDRYKTTMDIEGGGGMKLQIAFATTEKTVEIKSDGTMVRSITVDSADLVMGGQTMQMPGFKPATVSSTFDKDGKPVKEEGQGGQFIQMISMTRPTVEADKPLRVGEEWKTTLPTNKDGSKKLDVVVKLLGLEAKSDTIPVDAYKIKTVADGAVESPQGDQKVKMESVSFVTRDTGKVIRNEGTVTGLTIAQFGNAKITFKVVQQPEKPATAPAK